MEKSIVAFRAEAVNADPLVEGGGRAVVRARQRHAGDLPLGGRGLRGGGENRAAPYGVTLLVARLERVGRRAGPRLGDGGEGRRETGDELSVHGESWLLVAAWL